MIKRSMIMLIVIEKICIFKLLSRATTVRMLGQATPSSTRSWISDDTIWEGSTKRPDATQCSRIFRVSFTDMERSDIVDRSDAQSSCLDAVLFWEEYRYFGKMVPEDHPKAAK
jgi:hypothetical protein